MCCAEGETVVANERSAARASQIVSCTHFLALLDKGIVLCDAFESQLLHQIDLIGLPHGLLLERLDLSAGIEAGAVLVRDSEGS